MIRLAVDAVIAIFAKVSGLYPINVLPDAADRLAEREAASDYLEPRVVRPQVSPRPGVGAPSPRPDCAASAGTGGHLPCLHPEWN